MSTFTVMRNTMVPAPHATEPQGACGRVAGAPFPTPPSVAAEAAIATALGELYAGLREAVRAWGGQEALSAQVGLDPAAVSKRLNRKEDRGAICRAPIDWLVVVGLSSTSAADVIVRTVCELLGYEAPRRKAKRTPAEKLAAVARVLIDSGELGRATAERIAREAGCQLEEILGS